MCHGAEGLIRRGETGNKRDRLCILNAADHTPLGFAPLSEPLANYQSSTLTDSSEIQQMVMPSHQQLMQSKTLLKKNSMAFETPSRSRLDL